MAEKETKLITLDGLAHAAAIIRQAIPAPPDLSSIEANLQDLEAALQDKPDRAEIPSVPQAQTTSAGDSDHYIYSSSVNTSPRRAVLTAAETKIIAEGGHLKLRRGLWCADNQSGQWSTDSAIPTASASCDGLLSSADKARLDSLQSYAPATTSTDGLLSAEDKQKLTLAGINDNGASFVSGQVDDSTGSLQNGDYVVAYMSKGGVENAITLVRKQLPIPKGISALSYNVLNYTTIQNGDNVCCRVDEDGGCWYAPIRIIADPDGNEFLTASSTLSSSKLSGALPAISGASLTSLNASNLASGTVPSARLPTASASADGKLTSTNYKYLLSSTTATAITALSTAYRQIVASISASASLAFNTSSAFTAGREIHIIIKNTASADITVTLPNSGIYLTDTDTLTVPAGGYAEVNAISDGSKIYLRSAQ